MGQNFDIGPLSRDSAFSALVWRVKEGSNSLAGCLKHGSKGILHFNEVEIPDYLIIQLREVGMLQWIYIASSVTCEIPEDTIFNLTLKNNFVKRVLELLKCSVAACVCRLEIRVGTAIIKSGSVMQWG